MVWMIAIASTLVTGCEVPKEEVRHDKEKETRDP
jgi:hypothetical protein